MLFRSRCLLDLNTKKSERKEEIDYARGGIFIAKYHTAVYPHPALKVGCLSHQHITSQPSYTISLHSSIMFHPINSPRVENGVRCLGVKGERPSFLILAPSSFYEISQIVRTRPFSFSPDDLLMMVMSRGVVRPAMTA